MLKMYGVMKPIFGTYVYGIYTNSVLDVDISHYVSSKFCFRLKYHYISDDVHVTKDLQNVDIIHHFEFRVYMLCNYIII